MEQFPEKKGDAVRGHGVEDKEQQTSNEIVDALREHIKSRLLSGQTVSLIQFPEAQRAAAMGAIAALRDELPVSCRWTTVRESHLSETRLRARRYSIPGEHLHGEVTR